MPIISKMIGKAVHTETEKIEEILKDIVIEDERVELGFRVIRDMIVFTNLRIIFIDYQGMTGKKTEYISIPYRSITHFSVETAGHIDLDFDLKLWITGRDKAIEKKLRRDHGVAKDVIKILTLYTARIK